MGRIVHLLDLIASVRFFGVYNFSALMGYVDIHLPAIGGKQRVSLCHKFLLIDGPIPIRVDLFSSIGRIDCCKM